MPVEHPEPCAWDRLCLSARAKSAGAPPTGRHGSQWPTPTAVVIVVAQVLDLRRGSGVECGARARRRSGMNCE